ncbi:amidase domain-containing protein [Murdochiella massiliensis]|uniref:amidase domain-containing protein n=1 Tax=Murdochiella massiliensis TaxID=1673723 RepID=UPI0008314972|nr:amidase domain-containing protein [Murdochiella massiliensis]
MQNRLSKWYIVLVVFFTLMLIPSHVFAVQENAIPDEEQLYSLAYSFIFNTFSQEATGSVNEEQVDKNADNFLTYCYLRLEHNKLGQIPIDSRKMNLEVKKIIINDPYVDVMFRATEYIQYSGYEKTSILGCNYYIRFTRVNNEYKIVKAFDGGVFENEIMAYVEADYPEEVNTFKQKVCWEKLESNEILSAFEKEKENVLDEINYDYNDMVEASLDDLKVLLNETTSSNYPAFEMVSNRMKTQVSSAPTDAQRNAMRSYMERWAYDRNPAYLDVSPYGGDCANYASQIQRAGGARFDTSGNMSQNWFYYNSTPETGRSYSWTSASSLHEYLKTNSSGGMKGSRYWIHLYGQWLKVGDIVFLYRRTSSGNKSQPCHTLTTSSPDSGADNFLVTAHTVDCLDRPISRYSSAMYNKLAMYISYQ